MAEGILGKDPLPVGYLRGDRVVHGRLCVLALHGYPSPHASQVHPSGNQRIWGWEASLFTCHYCSTKWAHTVVGQAHKINEQQLLVQKLSSYFCCSRIMVATFLRLCDLPLVQGNHEGPKRAKTKLCVQWTSKGSTLLLKIFKQCCSSYGSVKTFYIFFWINLYM